MDIVGKKGSDMRPTFIQLVVGLVLGTAVSASLVLPGKVVIAKQPPMQQFALQGLAHPQARAPVVVEAAPLPRARVRLAPPAPPAPPRTVSSSPVAPLPSVTKPQPRPRRPAPQAHPPRRATQ